MSTHAPSAAPPDRGDLLAGALVFAVAAVVYLATLCPTVYVMDSPELVAVVDTFGVAHPPGYPLFTLLYGALVRVLTPLGDVALRANVVTALIAAAAVLVLSRAARALDVPRVPSAAGALAVAVARDWWVQANSTEVYALDGLLVALSILAAIRVVRSPGSVRGWTWFGLACGLAVGHRAPNVLLLAPLVIWADVVRRRAAAPRSGPLRFIVAGLLTTVVFALLPLAAAQDPPMNMGDPTDPGRLWFVLTAGPYARHLSTGTAGLAVGRLFAVLGRLVVVAPLLVVAAVYAVWTARRSGVARALLAVVFANIALVALYNVPDLEGFVQATFCALGVLAAMGVHAALQRVGARGTATALVLLGALLPAAWTWSEADLSGVRTVEAYGADLLAGAAPDSMVLCFDDTARNAMVFQQVVNGVGTDVAVVDPTASLAWHLDETRRRAPGFSTDGLSVGGESADGWIGRAAERLLRDDSRRLYTTDIAGVDLSPLIGPTLAARVSLVPSGLLYRAVLSQPGDPDPVRRGAELAIAETGSFWASRGLPELATARADPQLGFVLVRYARPRLLLAVAYVMAGDLASADVHLAAIADSDVDAREDAGIANLRTIGMDAPDWNAAARARRGRDAIRAGAGPQQVLLALAPR